MPVADTSSSDPFALPDRSLEDLKISLSPLYYGSLTSDFIRQRTFMFATLNGSLID